MAGFSSFFGSSGPGTRRVLLEIAGDDRNLDAALKRARKNVQSFGRETAALQGTRGILSQFGGKTGFLFGSSAFVGGALGAAALKTTIDAATRSQVILGQTKVAVNDLGLSWEKNSKRIQDSATRISKSSAFDDEAVLQSFQTLVRSTHDVGKAIQLTGLAANVARGRYVDLATGTQIVNKANLGLVGGLRRLGIQIDKNATAQEALAALQRSYGNAAAEYGKSAAGAQDRLRVSVENLQEKLGGALTPALIVVADRLSEVADAALHVESGLQRLADVKIPAIHIPFLLDLPGGKLGSILRGALGIADKVGPVGFANAIAQGVESFTNPFDPFKDRPGTGSPHPPHGGIPPRATGTKPPRTGPTLSREQSLLIQRDKATLNNYLSDDLKTAGALVAFYKHQVATAKNRKQLYAAEQNLQRAQSDLYGVQKQIADDATNAARKAGQAIKDKAKAAAAAQQKLIQTLASNAADFKNKVLASLDNRSTNLSTLHDLQDAKQKLRLAERLGGPATIREARYEVAQATLARKRALIEQSTVTSPSKGVYNFTGPITINGVTNVKQLIAELDKFGRRTSTQSRGRAPAGRPGRA